MYYKKNTKKKTNNKQSYQSIVFVYNIFCVIFQSQ